MKRQVSICILLSILVLVMVLFGIRFNKDSQQNNKQENSDNIENTQQTTEDNSQAVPSSKEYYKYYFYAQNTDGHVEIYDIKSQTLYMETGIETETLPEAVRLQLEERIYFENEEQLYSFLESYSS